MSEQRIFPELETSRLRLRNVSDTDTDFIFKLFSDETVCKYLYDEELFTKKEDAVSFVESYVNSEEKGYNRWILVKKEDGEQIGTCGFHCWDRTNHIAEVGYDLWHKQWGLGYMKEALTAAIESGFQHMNLNRINAYVALHNDSSVKLLESLGFKREGIYRDKHFFRGEYYDHYVYSLLKREWKETEVARLHL